MGLSTNNHRDQSNIFLRGNELLTVTGKHEETSAQGGECKHMKSLELAHKKIIKAAEQK